MSRAHSVETDPERVGELHLAVEKRREIREQV